MTCTSVDSGKALGDGVVFFLLSFFFFLSFSLSLPSSFSPFPSFFVPSVLGIELRTSRPLPLEAHSFGLQFFR
jgi:hypothetical protein